MTHCSHSHFMNNGHFPAAIGISTVNEEGHPCCGEHPSCNWVVAPDPNGGNLIYVSDLIGSGDVADMFGVRPTAVSNWRKRYAGTNRAFPEPIVTLNANSTAVFSRFAVVEWAKANGRAKA